MSWDGEYGSNFFIPGFADWVRDMQIPWWVADLRNSYRDGLRLVPHQAQPVHLAPQVVDPLGVGMNGRQEFEDLVELLLNGH